MDRRVAAGAALRERDLEKARLRFSTPSSAESSTRSNRDVIPIRSRCARSVPFAFDTTTMRRPRPRIAASAGRISSGTYSQRLLAVWYACSTDRAAAVPSERATPACARSNRRTTTHGSHPSSRRSPCDRRARAALSGRPLSALPAQRGRILRQRIRDAPPVRVEKDAARVEEHRLEHCESVTGRRLITKSRRQKVTKIFLCLRVFVTSVLSRGLVLLVGECDQGINPRGPSRGDDAGQERHDPERVTSATAPGSMARTPNNCVSIARGPNAPPRPRTMPTVEPEPSVTIKPKKSGARRCRAPSGCHFLAALRDLERQRAVNADGGEEERNAAEQGWPASSACAGWSATRRRAAGRFSPRRTATAIHHRDLLPDRSGDRRGIASRRDQCHAADESGRRGSSRPRPALSPSAVVRMLRRPQPR